MSAETLRTRWVLVTGGNKGIGLAIVEGLLARDFHIFLGSRSLDRATAAVETLPNSSRVEVVQIDVTIDASIRAAIETVKARCSVDGVELYGLVNNAGGASDLTYTSPSDLEAVLDLNYFGTCSVTAAVVPILQRGGRIVMVGSNVGPRFVEQCASECQRMLVDPAVTVEQLDGLVGRVVAVSRRCADTAADPRAEFKALGVGACGPYGLSKAAVASYAVAIARAHPHLTVNTCHPGMIETDLTRAFAEKRGLDLAGMGLHPVSDGARCPVVLMADEVPTPQGESWFFSSDVQRSPLHKHRTPGDPPFDGIILDL